VRAQRCLQDATCYCPAGSIKQGPAKEEFLLAFNEFTNSSMHCWCFGCIMSEFTHAWRSLLNSLRWRQGLHQANA
jgi:hypothetical protein